MDRTNFPGYTLIKNANIFELWTAENGIHCYGHSFLHMMEKKSQNIEWLSQNTKIKSQYLALSSQNNLIMLNELSSENNGIKSLKLKTVCLTSIIMIYNVIQ